MKPADIRRWLRTDDPQQLRELWQRADRVRRESVGDTVHLRGLLEFSNRCIRHCHYCGLRADRRDLHRYVMEEAEIVSSARTARAFDLRTIVLQSGEDFSITAAWLADLIRRIKTETDLAVTLSLGERREDELELWKAAGADRYLLKFETANRRLLDIIHPPRNAAAPDRPALIRFMKEIGYEVGSGILVGIPGQTYEDLVRDLELLKELDVDMIGCGPFISHDETPLGRGFFPFSVPPRRQVPASQSMAFKVLALTRLLNPLANIPATTALYTVGGEQGRENGLRRGANVIMINITPQKYRHLYQIYPSRIDNATSITSFVESSLGTIRDQIKGMGRPVAAGSGPSLHFLGRRRPNPAYRDLNRNEVHHVYRYTAL